MDGADPRHWMAQAQAWAEQADGGLPLQHADAVGLAWALKDLCYAAWASEPQRAQGAAAALQRLRLRLAEQAGSPLTEVDALAAWTAGIAHLTHGAMAPAVEALDQAQGLFLQLDARRHAAQTQVPKIMALAMQGRHDDAARCAAAAHQALLAEGDEAAAAKVLLNLGNLHLRSHRWAPAAECFEKAAALFETLQDVQHAVMAEIGLADALMALGELQRALSRFTHAAQRAAAGGFAVLQVLAEESRAMGELARGRLRAALAGLQHARDRYEALQMPQHLAIVEKQIADVYLELRLLPEAQRGYARAMARFGALTMQVDRAWAQVQQARALALAGHLPPAEAALAEAAQAFASLGLPTGQAEVALVQAELALTQGASHSALASAAVAARLVPAESWSERWLRAGLLHAQALLQAGRAEPARAGFQTVLQSARRHGLMALEWRALAGSGAAARALGRIATARRELQEAAQALHAQRRALPDDELRGTGLGDALHPLRQLLSLALQDHVQQHGPATARAVLQQLDALRARTLADHVAARAAAGDGDRAPADGGNPGAPAGTPDPEGPADHGLEPLRSRMAWLTRRLSQADSDGDDAAGLLAQLRETEHQLVERTRRQALLEGLDGGAGEADPTSTGELPPLDLDALQALLGHDEAAADPDGHASPRRVLVAYGIEGDELWAGVVDARGVHVVRRLATWSQVQATVRALRFQLDTLRHGRAPVQRHLTQLQARTQTHLRRLHGWLWQPLRPWLGASGQALVVPTAELGALPFAALHDGRRCLAEDWDLAFSPSPRMALQALRRAQRVPLPLTAGEAARPRVLALGEASRLEHAEREARQVADWLPHGLALCGPSATQAALRQHAPLAGVLHLACHAQFRADSPPFSALHLHDGPLTAHTVAGWSLPAQLVVLSGCETALHDTAAHGEMPGLTRAFLKAGAARVLASLWPVDDALTAQWMERFYAGLGAGLGPARAMRLAQHALRQQHPHPFYWAPFCLTGIW